MNLLTFVKLGEYTPNANDVSTIRDKLVAGMNACKIEHCDVARLVFPEGETVDLISDFSRGMYRKDTIAKIEFYIKGVA